ncbi:MAG: Transcriptional regulator, GntR family [Anaerolineae bacterium]|jgi:GntR family transcriptional regulator|nr:MAG: Transcriptional regulator, GntR family [Anaerolineae bacterium]
MVKEPQPIFDDRLDIDRDSFEPAYIQLANILRRQIAEGLFRPGDQLPSESQLCHRYGISPMTVRRTINLLADEGLISTAQGRGTFVKSIELSEATFGLQELKDLFKPDQQAQIKLLDARVVSADERTARKLEITCGSPVIYIRRLFSRAGQPVFYHRAYLIYDPTRPIVEAELDVTSLQGLFAGGNHSLLKFGTLNIECTLLTNEEAELLKRPYPFAAFYLEHLFYDYEDHPLSWGWFIIPADCLHFTAQVGVSSHPGIHRGGK